MSSIALKCALILFALLCVLQFAEMARVQRSPDGEEPATQLQFDKILTDIKSQLQDIMRTVSDSETAKQLLASANSVINENASKFKGVFEEIQNGLKDSNAGTKTDTVKD